MKVKGQLYAPTSLPSRIEMLCMLERRLRGSQDGPSGEKPRLSLRQESIADSPVPNRCTDPNCSHPARSSDCRDTATFAAHTIPECQTT